MTAENNSDVSESTGQQQERPNPPNSLATDTMKTIPGTLIPIVSPERWVNYKSEYKHGVYIHYIDNRFNQIIIMILYIFTHTNPQYHSKVLTNNIL